ncbi:MAG: hypothetical protein M3Q65_07835 [Chloroflexota bacterium]|nr:hypothetical protein [Chloroflexota bacterium]
MVFTITCAIGASVARLQVGHRACVGRLVGLQCLGVCIVVDAGLLDARMVPAPPALQSSPSPVPVATLLFAFGWMLLVALLLASGWVLVHGGPRPQQSAWRVVLLAVLLYVLVGLAWELVYVLTNPYGDRPHPGFLLFALIWPWHVAFMFGLLGLGPR